MAFVKPYTYVDGAVLTAENQKSNDEAAKEYVNQNIAGDDFVLNAIGTEEISPGEIEPITKSMRFECNAHYAAHNDIEQLNRAYFTSHIKPRAQQSNTKFIYQPLWETGTEVNVEYPSRVIVDFGGTFISLENEVRSNRWWDSVVFLEQLDLQTGEITRFGSTRGYSFEEVNVTATGNPNAGGNVDPWNGNEPGNVLNNESETRFAVRRWIGFRKHLTLQPGRYAYRTVINAKVEQGFTSARNFTIEVFHGTT
jgi:hypothetical protein